MAPVDSRLGDPGLPRRCLTQGKNRGNDKYAMTVTVTKTTGLFNAALSFARSPGDRPIQAQLEASALRYAINRLRRTGERIAGIPDAITLLEQMADVPCAGHSGTSPLCVDHEL